LAVAGDSLIPEAEAAWIKMEWEPTEGENDIKEMLIKFKVVHPLN
jgi:hypothetical protein